MSLSVVTVSGSLHAPSKTAALVTAITTALGELLDISVTTVEVHELGLALSRSASPEPARVALDAIEAADLLVAASPVYRASYTGQFKHLFDLVAQPALTGKPVLLAATGGNDLHSLVIEHQLRPLFGFFGALSLPLGVYATDADFTDYRVSSERLSERIDAAVAAALPLLAPH